MVLNDIFDKIIILTIPKRQDRRDKLDPQLIKLNIKAEYYYGQVGNPYAYHRSLRGPEVGHLLSTIAILKYCQKNQWSKILILEDDAEFIKDFDYRFMQSWYNLPKDWEMFYLSGNHNEFNKYSRRDKEINQYIYKCNYCLTTGAYAVKLEVIPKLLARLEGDPPWSVWIETIDKQTDMIFAELMAEGVVKAYATKPSLVIQADGYSNIQEAYISYKDCIL